MKKTKLILVTLLAFAMLLAVSCSDAICTSHADNDADGKCDSCGNAIGNQPCTECSDTDGDGKCDECGKDVEKQPCTECKDEDENGKCDVCGGAVEIDNGEVKLIENGKANFNIIFQSELSEESIELIEALIDELAELGVTVNAARDIPYGIQDCEVLIGSVTSRGEEYVRDVRELGTKGYAVELFGKKVVVSFGSEAVLEDAIESFKIDFLGISPTTESLKNVTVTTDNDFVEVQDDYRIKTLSINGEDMRGFTISADKNDENEYATALSIQDMFYNKTGYWLEIVPHSENGKTIVVKLVPRTGELGFYVNVEGDKLLVTCEYFTCIKKESETYFNNKIARAGGTGILNFTSGDNTSVNVRDVYYKDFGAVGDGRTDDSEAIRACHVYANQAGHVVHADNHATYYLGPMTSAITIKTNVNWGNAKFTIDDRNIAPDDGEVVNGKNVLYRSVDIFKVARDYSSVTLTASNNATIKAINQSGGINAATIEKLDLGLGYPAMLLVNNANHTNYIRYGVNANDGSSQQEIVVIDAEGNIDPTTKIMFDYEQITSINVYRIDDESITIEGGIFTTRANHAPKKYTSYARGITISRPNTIFYNVHHYITDEQDDQGAPYAGFGENSYAYNVTIKNCVFTAHKTYTGTNGAGMGTYDIGASRSAKIVWLNCTQSNFFVPNTETTTSGYWGIMGSSYSKDISYVGSTLSRFDAHAGVYNASIIDSKISMFRIVGSGTLTFENTHMYGNLLIGLREDYGAFWHGDIIIKNVTMHNTGDVNLISGTWYNHDFGYPTAFPYTITVDGLKLTVPAKVNLFKSDFVTQSNNIIKDYLTKEVNKTDENGNVIYDSNGNPVKETVKVPNINKTPAPREVIIKNMGNLQINLPDVEAYPYFADMIVTYADEKDE